MLKTPSIAIACLVCLPLSAAAAVEGTSFLPSLSPLLFVLLGLFVLVCWRELRARGLQQHNRELTARLSLAEQTVAQAPLPILRLDAGLRVIAANHCALRIYDRPALLGVSLLDLHPDLADHPVVVAAQAANADAHPAAPVLFPEPGTSKTVGPGELAMIATAGQHQTLWFGPPPTNRLLIQAASDAASLAEESANRMKSEFIANINHEVRTPMNAIIGYTEMLANSPLGPKEQRFVAIIHKSSMALVSIFNDIMELSKIDSGRLQIMVSTIRLPSIINDVEGLFKDLAEEKGIHLSCRIAGHLPQSFVFDGVRLKQILQNLVGNAVKFTHEGSVALLVDGVPAAAKQGRFDLRFAVEDTGIGISETDQAKIFELFRQREDVITKKYGGVGLGLTLCSRLAAMMGGRIELHSAVGKGSRFILFLDGVEVAEPASARPASDAAAPRQKEEGRKLLVVDDVDLIKDVFLDYFQDSPLKVLTADNGEEALTLARTEHPDIIFMDLNLTGTDGRNVTEELRRNPDTAAIPVVVMTGEMLEEGDYRPLFDGFLQKPFRLEELREIVARSIPLAPRQAEPSAMGDGGDEEEHHLLRQIAEAWNNDLELLRQQAVFSGSLTDAAALGIAMQRRGVEEKQPILTELGEELLLYAQEPDILGVDRLLAQFSRITNRNEP